MKMELKSWYSVCTPHEDIKKGNLDESSFAIDLWGVITGNAPEMYSDSEEFFKKTYFTEGLKSVLTKAAKVLYGISESSDRILGLQTSFGGGKTHLLSALYHLAKSPNIEKLLKALNIDLTEIKPAKVNVAVSLQRHLHLRYLNLFCLSNFGLFRFFFNYQIVIL
jgi:predicted AAA+ superfamily ATPase